MEVAASTVTSIPFLRRELNVIGVIADPAKTVALPPKAVELTETWPSFNLVVDTVHITLQRIFLPRISQLRLGLGVRVVGVGS